MRLVAPTHRGLLSRTILLALLGLAAILAGIALAPRSVAACEYNIMMNKYNTQKSIDSVNDPTYAKSWKVWQKIKDKFKNRPSAPTPPPPPAGTPPSKSGGSGDGGGFGRGGAIGGIGRPGGGPIGHRVWARNLATMPCNVSWTIVPDPANPPGFSISPGLSGAFVAAPPMAVVLDPFDVTIAPFVAPGAVAFFDVYFFDSCAGDTYTDEMSRFSVVASPDLEVDLLVPVVPVTDGVPFSVSWMFRNDTASPIMKSYSFVGAPDPFSVADLNTGVMYPITNAYPVDKTVTGGTVSLAPGQDEEIRWDLESAEYCDPEMLGCCGVQIGNAVSCVLTPNNQAGPYHQSDGFKQLSGHAVGGFVGFRVITPHGVFQAQVPTFPGQPIPQILDGLAQAALQQVSTVNGFNFPPVINVLGMILMHPEDGTIVEFFSGDPGLSWQPLTGVEDPDLVDFVVRAMPNPSRESVTFLAMLPTSGHARLVIHDLAGRRVSTPLDQQVPGGLRAAIWSTIDDRGRPVEAGTYFYRLTLDAREARGTLIVAR